MNDATLVGVQLDEYRLEEKLGEGGMASVYRALDVRLNRYVAIKVIRTSFRTESDYSMRFEREAQAIAQLEHPHIITLYRFGEIDGLLYMAMQFVNGADLAAVIESYQADDAYVETEEVIRLIHEVGAALDYAHSKGVIHRDIKPHNVMLKRDGHALVADFGLALMTEIGTLGEIFGSPHYIAPEQAISSAGVVPQSDLYALGVVLYEMLTGVVPFDSSEPLDVAMMHMSEPVPSPRLHRPELGEDIEKVLLKVLAKEPTDRYPTGKAFADAVEQALLRVPQSVSPPTRPTIPHRVALEIEAHPLPPLPTPVMIPTKPHESQETLPAQIISSEPNTTPARSRRPLYAGIGLMVVILLVAILLNNASNGNDGSGVSATEQITVVALITEQQTPTNTPEPVSTNTPLVTATDIPIPTTVPIEDTASQSTDAPSYAIVIRWRGNDSLFVTNISAVDFPIHPLQLSGEGQVAGPEWAVENLANGECVAIWKNDKDDKPADENCVNVGPHLIRGGSERFWRDDFVVFYADELITTCSSSPCLIIID